MSYSTIIVTFRNVSGKPHISVTGDAPGLEVSLNSVGRDDECVVTVRIPKDEPRITSEPGTPLRSQPAPEGVTAGMDMYRYNEFKLRIGRVAADANEKDLPVFVRDRSSQGNHIEFFGVPVSLQERAPEATAGYMDYDVGSMSKAKISDLMAQLDTRPLRIVNKHKNKAVMFLLPCNETTKELLSTLYRLPSCDPEIGTMNYNYFRHRPDKVIKSLDNGELLCVGDGRMPGSKKFLLAPYAMRESILESGGREAAHFASREVQNYTGIEKISELMSDPESFITIRKGDLDEGIVILPMQKLDDVRRFMQGNPVTPDDEEWEESQPDTEENTGVKEFTATDGAESDGQDDASFAEESEQAGFSDDAADENATMNSEPLQQRKGRRGHPKNLFPMPGLTEILGWIRFSPGRDDPPPGGQADLVTDTCLGSIREGTVTVISLKGGKKLYFAGGRKTLGDAERILSNACRKEGVRVTPSVAATLTEAFTTAAGHVYNNDGDPACVFLGRRDRGDEVLAALFNDRDLALVFRQMSKRDDEEETPASRNSMGEFEPEEDEEYPDRQDDDWRQEEPALN